MGQSQLKSPVNSGLLTIKSITNILELSLRCGVKAQWDAFPGIQSRPCQHKEESLSLQSSVLIALLQRCVWDCAQQHLLEGTERRVSCPTVCRVRVGRGGRHLHTRVSMRAFAHPFSFPVSEGWLWAPAFQTWPLGVSDFWLWGACGRWSPWNELKLFPVNLCGFISDGATDMISTFKANSPCKDVDKPDFST